MSFLGGGFVQKQYVRELPKKRGQFKKEAGVLRGG